VRERREEGEGKRERENYVFIKKGDLIDTLKLLIKC